MAYRIDKENRGGGTVYKLVDESTGASASVLPSSGFNLFDLRLPVADRILPIIDAAPGWADKPGSFGRNGTPVLFPYPNRVRGARFAFEGKTYELPAANGANAIHGFAISAPWDVEGQQVDERGASIAGVYQIARQSPEMLDRWPADAVLRIQYTLSGRSLTLEATITNPSAQSLPYGFGIHPYFRLPLAGQGDLARTRVVLPAKEFWVLDEFLPTGEIRPVDDRLDFRKGQSMVGLKLDDVLTGLDGDPRVCRLVDEQLNAEFQLCFDTHFRELVVYTPPGPGGVISLEPYTQTTDAINLQAKGIEAGLRLLEHGQSETLRITMQTVG